MITEFLFITTVILSPAIATPAVDNNAVLNTILATKSSQHLQALNHCECIDYFCCDADERLQNNEVTCPKTSMVCCKHESACVDVPSGYDGPDDGTTVPTSTTTRAEQITLRGAIMPPISSKSSCGVARTLLSTRTAAFSENTVPGEVPWIVAIFEKRQANSPYKFKCAGSLIHPRVILTATHCVLSAKAEYLKIVATGKETFQNLGNADNEKNVEQIVTHENYYSGGLHNDIALLILTEEFNYDKHQLNSICLPKLNDSFTGKNCQGIGWGYNPTLEAVPLKKVDVPVVAFNQCQNLVRNAREQQDFDLHSSFMCAGGEEGRDTCKGDGGGPLICFGDEFKAVQAGIVSWGINNQCGKAKQPGIYTDVAKFRQWIDKKLGADDVNIIIKK